MAFKTRRQRRYDILRFAGFLPFEAQVLSRIPFKVPYMDALIKGRYERLEFARENKWPWAKYKRSIMWDYAVNRWQRRTRLGRIKDDPWQMLRAFEDDYRAKNPDYSSPWEKRRRDFKRFVSKIEQQYEKYPKGYGQRYKDYELRYKPGGGAEMVKKKKTQGG